MEGSELISKEWHTGSLDKISWLTNIVGYVSSAILALGGFILVILPVCQLCFDCIYFGATKYCDRVAQAHEAKFLNLSRSEGGGFSLKMDTIEEFNSYENGVAKIGSGLVMLFLTLNPNFKLMANHAEINANRGTFLMRAGIKTIGSMSLGFFIYLGYVPTVSLKIQSFTDFAFKAVMNNVNPEDLARSLGSLMVESELSTEGLTDPESTEKHEIMSDMWSAVISRYSDMGQEPKKLASRIVEEEFEKFLAAQSEMADLLASDVYKLSYNAASIKSAEPSIDKLVNGVMSDDERDYTIAFSFPCSVFSELTNDVNIATDYMRVDIRMVLVPKEKVERRAQDLTLVVPESCLSENTYTFNPQASTGKGRIKFRATNHPVDSFDTDIGWVRHSESHATLTFPTATTGIEDFKTVGLTYIDNSGTTHQVTRIVYDSEATDYVFLDADNHEFPYGGSPEGYDEIDEETEDDVEEEEDKEEESDTPPV